MNAVNEERSRPGRHLAAFALLLLAEIPDHGHHLHRRLNEVLPEALKVDAGNLYRALRELETQKMLQSIWDTDGSGPAKRIYSVTPAGKAELMLWRADMADRRNAFDWFLQHCQALMDLEDESEKP